ncbi:MAG TPA: sulfate ABC transporter permease subunit CysT [Gemmatimonadaceae bacterium]|nr:sulfate ABC transporter permease subunit CysT [Gemmatimonadaceae bacterium]
MQVRASPLRLTLRAAVTAYVGLLAVLPLAALARAGFASGLGSFWASVSSPTAVDALWISVWTALVATVANVVFGTATAWALVRYDFPGRRILDSLVDVPFAMPTLVAGLMIAELIGPASPAGRWLDARGVPIIFTASAIILALMFVTVPFVVRAVQPVLAAIDPAEEEAGRTLGAGPIRIFATVVLPALAPSILSGALQSFSRSLAEFGSIVVVSGNIPHRTLTAPVFIFGQVESGDLSGAAATSLVLLILALLFAVSARAIHTRSPG